MFPVIDHHYQASLAVPFAPPQESEAQRSPVRLPPGEGGLSVRSGTVRTKPDRAVTFELPCDANRLSVARRVHIQSPPRHGVLKAVGMLYFEVPDSDEAAERRCVSGPPLLQRYIPEPGFVGTDYFSFQISDGPLRSETATVAITVREENLTPVALSQSLSVKLGESIWIELGGVDEDNDPLQVTITTWPTAGTLRVPTAADYFGLCDAEEDDAISRPFPPLPRHYIYEPNLLGMESSAEAGPLPIQDHFAFTVTDGECTSEPATVELALRPFNRAPQGCLNVPLAVSAWSRSGMAVVVGQDASTAVVTLDGHQSTDPDGDEIQIWWGLMERVKICGSSRHRSEESLISSGMEMTTTLGIGSHTIVAHVSDGSLEDDCRMVVKVISPATAIARLSAEVRGLKLPTHESKPVLELLKKARALAKSGALRAAATELGKFQRLWEALPSEPEDSPLTQTAESIILAIHPPVAIAPFLAQRLDAGVE